MPIIIYSDQFLAHDTGRFHPESPQRLEAIIKALKTLPWQDQLVWQSLSIRDQRNLMDWIETIHDPRLLQQIKAISAQGGGNFDPDTPLSPESYQIALLAVSAWLDGVDTAWNQGQPAFVLARPPGHHATRDYAMGFCLLSNAAIAAHYALSLPKLNRVAILDWDVHHGNGTESLVESNPQIAYCSLHQFPCYPGTGKASDQGAYQNVLNIPMLAGSTIREYQKAFEEQVVPFLQAFKPDLLIVSAGYDANEQDPLASIALQPQDYGILTRYCYQVCHHIMFGLEGGYHLEALAESVVATLANCLVS